MPFDQLCFSKTAETLKIVDKESGLGKCAGELVYYIHEAGLFKNRTAHGVEKQSAGARCGGGRL